MEYAALPTHCLHTQQRQFLLPSWQEPPDARDSTHSGTSLPSLIIAVIVAVALHGLLLLFPEVPASPASPSATSRLQLKVMSAAPQQARAITEPVPEALETPQKTPGAIAQEEAPATAGEAQAPVPPVESALQRYLRYGELPANVPPPAQSGPEHSTGSIFSPKLRQQLAQAKARRRGSNGSQQRHIWNAGEQYEQQHGKCFIGREMVHESGTTTVWYPTKCRGKDAAADALRRLRLP